MYKLNFRLFNFCIYIYIIHIYKYIYIYIYVYIHIVIESPKSHLGDNQEVAHCFNDYITSISLL